MKRAVCRSENKFTKLPMFDMVLGRDKYSNLEEDQYMDYFGAHLLDLYGPEIFEHLQFEKTEHTEREFAAIIAKPVTMRTYFIVSLKGKMELTSGMGDKKLVQEGRVVALSNPLASQVGVSVRIKDCIGKACVHVYAAYPRDLISKLT